MELLIVIVLGSLILAVTAPAVVQMQRRGAARTAADRFMATVMLTRSSAIKYGRLAELHLDNGTDRMWIQMDTAGTGVPDTIGLVHDLSGERVQLNSSRSLICYGASGSASSRGTCGSGMTVVVFTAGGYADTAWVTAAGNALR